MNQTFTFKGKTFLKIEDTIDEKTTNLKVIDTHHNIEIFNESYTQDTKVSVVLSLRKEMIKWIKDVYESPINDTMAS